MLAISEIPAPAHVWQMPISSARRHAVGEAARQAALEAAEAMRRFRGLESLVEADFMLDPATADSELRAFAREQGFELDVLLEGAARHFHTSSIRRATEPLTEQELDVLFEDDQRALDR